LTDGWPLSVIRSCNGGQGLLEGSRLHLTRRLEGARRVYPPEELPDLVAWLRALAADDVPYLVLEPGNAP